MTVAIPDLTHRTSAADWLGEIPVPLSAEWVAERYNDVLSQLVEEGLSSVDAIRRSNELEAVISGVLARAGLAFRQNTTDAAATAEYERLQSQIVPVVTEHGVAFAKALLDAPDASTIEREFGTRYLRLVERTVQLHDPRNIPLRVELSKTLMRHTDIFAKATVTWRGETLPFSYARKAAHDPDRAERHNAFHSSLETVQNNEDELQQIFDEAMRIRRSIADNAGRSFVDLRYLEMGRFDYGPAEVAQFRDAVERYVAPVGEKLRAQQAAHLGEPLVHPADLQMWPDPTPELVVGIDRQLGVAAEGFSALGAEFGEPFAEMMRENLIDLPARPGKGTGAFCTSFDDAGVPYIFCNSVDTPDDVKTLVHEFGHALQYWRSRDIELIDLRSPSLEACEIHSMSLELLFSGQAELFFGDQADVFRREHLRSTLLSVPYMAAVDEFQHALYAEAGAPSGGVERGDAWLEISRRYVRGIDTDAEPWYARNRWLMQLHIFQYPFYYIDYALAQMVSWELWLDSLTDFDAAKERYLALCSSGGTMTFRELLGHHGVGDPFDAATVERTMARLQPHLGV